MTGDRPSSTALVVARGLAVVAESPELAILVPERAAELNRILLIAESRSSARFVALTRSIWFRRLVFAMQRFVIPGILPHYALRKRFIEDVVRGALGEGFEQVVVLGAGFDTLAMRLAEEFPGRRFYEIDHPATQAAKRGALTAGSQGGSNFVLAATDLAAAELEAELAALPGFDPDAATVFVAEGLLMYLPEASVAQLLSSVARYGRIRIVFTAMAFDESGAPGFRQGSRFVKEWLRRRGEPFLWGMRSEAMAEFLERASLSLVDLAGPSRLRRDYLGKLGHTVRIAEGEWIYVADGM